MTALGVVSRQCTLASALAAGRSALGWVEAEQRPALVSAAVSGDALVLGRLQRERTLRERSPARFDSAIERRATTGTEAQISGAALYHALALPRVDALFPDASARTLLNRNLRALLRGYTAASVPLRYFGTEVLALLGHPVALVGYDRLASGAVLIEVLLGLDAPCVVRSALKREPPASLYSVLRSEPPAMDLLQRAVQGTVERLGASSFEIDLPSAAPAPPLEIDAAPVEASVAIPLGLVEAAGAKITGDLLVGTAALAQVEERARAALDARQPLTDAVLEPLRGAPLDGARPADLLQALDAAFSARSIAPRTP